MSCVAPGASVTATWSAAQGSSPAPCAPESLACAIPAGAAREPERPSSSSRSQVALRTAPPVAKNATRSGNAANGVRASTAPAPGSISVTVLSLPVPRALPSAHSTYP